MIYKDYVDINVTVASSSGLVVPVLKNCETLSIVDAERQVKALTDKAARCVQQNVPVEQQAQHEGDTSSSLTFPALHSFPSLFLIMPASAVPSPSPPVAATAAGGTAGVAGTGWALPHAVGHWPWRIWRAETSRLQMGRLPARSLERRC